MFFSKYLFSTTMVTAISLVTSVQAADIPFENHLELGDFYPFTVHKPAGDNPPTKPPINLFLHGTGSRGDAGTMDTLVTWNGPGIRLQEYYNGNLTESSKIVAEEFLTVMPLAPNTTEKLPNWNVTGVIAVLQFVEENYDYDPDRVYLSGYSMGARGAWEILIANASSFAAAAISAGEPDPTTDFTNLLDVPIKHYAATEDFEDTSNVGVANRTQRLIEQAGGTKCQLEIVSNLPEPAHNSMADEPFSAPMFSDLLANVGTGSKTAPSGSESESGSTSSTATPSATVSSPNTTSSDNAAEATNIASP